MSKDYEEMREIIDQEVDTLARQLLDCINLQNHAVAITALSAAFHHIAYKMMESDYPGPFSSERVVQACFNEGIRYAQFLNETRKTLIKEATEA